MIQDIHLFTFFWYMRILMHHLGWEKKRQKQGRCYVQPYTASCSSPALCNMILPSIEISISYVPGAWEFSPFFDKTFWYEALLVDHQPADLFDRHVQMWCFRQMTKKAYASGSLFPACSASCALLLFELYRNRLTVTNGDVVPLGSMCHHHHHHHSWLQFSFFFSPS